MTAPAVQGRATSVSSTSNATTFTPSLPASIAAGELLVALVSSAGGGTLSTTSTGWRRYTPTVLNGTAVGATMFFKPAATGSDTLSVTSTSSTQYSAVVLRLPANTFMYLAGAFATSTNSDPPLVNHLKSRDALYIAVRFGAGTTVATVAPSGYSNLQTATGGGASGASTNTAEKSTTATSSENPGTFTSGSAAWVATTIAFWTGNSDPIANWKTNSKSLSANRICLFVGDSLTSGATAATGGMAANQVATARPAVFASTFTANKASSANWFGDGGINPYQSSGFHNYDNRIAVGAAWQGSNCDGSGILGLGAGYSYGATASQTLDFTPGVSFDHYRVRFLAFTGSPQATVKVDSGSATTLVQNTGSGSITSTDFAASGTTIHITSPGLSGGNAACILGIETWVAATPQITVLNAGWFGSSTADQAVSTNFYSPLNAISAVAPDLTVLCLGSNDPGAGLTEAQTKANSRLLILTAMISGEVHISQPPYADPTAIGGVAEATQRSLMTYAEDLAAELGCSTLIIADKTGWTSYATANGNGYMAADGSAHCSTAGYAAWAEQERLILDPGPYTAALTGFAGTIGRGALAAVAAFALSGAVATGAGGTLAPSGGSTVSQALTGFAATMSAGSLTPTAALGLIGTAATGAGGSLAGALSVGLTGSAATGAKGSVVAAPSITLTGSAATGAEGALTASAAAVLSGLSATGGIGTLNPNTLIGITATISGGSLGLTATAALTGLSATGGVGVFGVFIPDPALIAQPLTSRSIQAGPLNVASLLTAPVLSVRTITAEPI